MIEVPVARMQHEIVLQHKRRQPHVVGRNWCALFPELAEHGRVVVGRLVVGEENAHPVFQQEPPKYSLVLGLPAPVREPCSKLAENHERQCDGLCLLQKRHRRHDSFTEIDVTIRVESYPHRQRSSSTWS